VNGDQPTEEQAQRETPKVQPVAEDLPKAEPDAGPPPDCGQRILHLPPA
jgi:hypothetical protein